MNQVNFDKNLIAYCGLYCGSCKKYLLEKCPGCRENESATWCKIRKCGIENKYFTCVDCGDFKDVKECKKYNNFIAKIFAIIFRSNRPACIDAIREMGPDAYAEEMASKGKMVINK